MVRVYGESDDLVVVEGTKTEFDEINCFDSVCSICFDDGTKIDVQYPKKVDGVAIGVWGITVNKKGSAEQELAECFDEEADWYTDIFTINSDISSVWVE